jgi:hypothetical protein
MKKKTNADLDPVLIIEYNTKKNKRTCFTKLQMTETFFGISMNNKKDKYKEYPTTMFNPNALLSKLPYPNLSKSRTDEASKLLLTISKPMISNMGKIMGITHTKPIPFNIIARLSF